jgi:raffinose/stachyose/melibiose transport system permease protein
MAMATETTARRPVRWHIAVFLAPAVLVYTAIMILPLIGTLQQSFFHVENGKTVFVGFVWKLILSPLWGIAPSMLGLVGLKEWFAPWLGDESYALTTVAHISVWQFVGIPMMLIYAALLSIPDEILEAAECDGITGLSQFWKIKLPLILPSIGIISVLTFVGNFNAFDLVYVTQGALAGPNGSTDILGTFHYRTFFGFQLQLGDPHMGAAIASVMFLIILAGVSLYLFGIQTRLRRYQF